MIGGSAGPQAMKWESPPLALFAAPALLGLGAAMAGFGLAPQLDLEQGTFFSDLAPLLASWAFLLLFTAFFVHRIPAEWGDPKEMRLGVWTGVGFAFLPQILGVGLIFCSFWFLAIIGIWLFFSTYQWKLDAPPFRTGFWIGLGGLAGMYLGALAMGILLNA